MKYKYRYEAILSYKEHLKDKAAVEFAMAQGNVNRIRNLIAGFEKEISDTNDSMEKRMRDKISSNDILNYSEFITALQIKIEIQRIELLRAEQEVSEKRKNLLEKSRQCRIFEKLKEKDFKKWNTAINQLELKEINEAAIVRHGKDFL